MTTEPSHLITKIKKSTSKNTDIDSLFQYFILNFFDFSRTDEKNFSHFIWHFTKYDRQNHYNLNFKTIYKIYDIFNEISDIIRRTNQIPRIFPNLPCQLNISHRENIFSFSVFPTISENLVDYSATNQHYIFTLHVIKLLQTHIIKYFEKMKHKHRNVWANRAINTRIKSVVTCPLNMWTG